MSDEFTGNADLGTGEIAEVQVDSGQSAEVQDLPGESQQVQSDNQHGGLEGEVARLRDENRRLAEYNDFLKQRPSQYQPQGAVATQEDEDLGLNPNDVPYVSDVEKIAQKTAGRMFQQMQREQHERDMEVQLRSLSDEKRKTDSNFDNRMNLAIEILGADELSQAAFAREQTAEGKIKVLERIASFHPMYDTYKPAQKAPAVNEAIERMKQNQQIPQTLAGVPGTGVVERQFSQLSDEEKIAEINRIKSQA